MKIKELIYSNEYIFSEADEDIEITRISTNITDIDENTLLIIPNSAKLDKITNEERIPAAVITDDIEKTPESFPKILVENPRLALSNACFRFEGLDLSKMKIIGVTGTNGKTTTATFIKSALEYEGYKVGFIGTGKIEIAGKVLTNEQYSMTTPDPTVLYSALRKMQEESCNAVVMEVSSHALALSKVAPITFDYALFTNLSPEHLDFHADMESYFASKLKLFENANVGVYNLDDPYAMRAYEMCKARKVGIGAIHKGDAVCTDVKNLGLRGVSYIYNDGKRKFRVSLPISGVYNVYNSMLAAAVSIDMGCRAYRVKEALGKVENIPGRFEIIKDEITVIIDYAHTDSAYYNIMKELHSIKGVGRLWAIFGCGGERDREKRPRIAEAVEKFADKIIVTADNSRGEDPKDIISDIIRGFTHKSYEINEDRRSAISDAILAAASGDTVAILGKGAEKYNIDKNGYHNFDEKEIISTALEIRKRRLNHEN